MIMKEKKCLKWSHMLSTCTLIVLTWYNRVLIWFHMVPKWSHMNPSWSLMVCRFSPTVRKLPSLLEGFPYCWIIISLMKQIEDLASLKTMSWLFELSHEIESFHIWIIWFQTSMSITMSSLSSQLDLCLSKLNWSSPSPEGWNNLNLEGTPYGTFTI